MQRVRVHSCRARAAAVQANRSPASLVGVASPGLAPRRVRAPPCKVAYVVSGGVKKSVEQAEVDVSKQLYKLQNGSDVRGVAVAGVPDEPVTLTPLAAFMIARGFGVWVGEKLGIPPSGLRVSVGSDPRISSEPLKTAVLVGLASLGCSVADFGLATTPAMFFSTIATGHKYDGAIMLTASHLPFNRNGMKFFTADGGLEKANIKELLATAVAQAEERGLVLNNPRVDPGFVLKQALLQDPMALSQVEFLPEYSAFLRGLIKAEIDAANFDRPLDGFKIVVDAGNGSGGFFASQVLEPLGADVSASQFLEPDGMFPNHVPNPEDSGAMQATMAAVNAAGADLGIVFDTDVDRSGIVDNRGSAINSNRFIALMASVVLKQHPGSTIVTDSVTSNGLSQFIEKLGGKHFRYRRGYKNVIGKGVELNTQGVDCELMMETSGHGAMRSNYYLDDGAYLAVMVVIEMVRRRLAGQGGVGELLDELAEPKEAAEMRLRINSDDFKDVAAAVLQRFHDWVEDGAGGAGTWALEPVNHEGWRVAIDEGDGCKGWVLLRASLHDPILVVNAESDVAGGLVPIREKLLEFCAAASIPSDDLPVNIASIQT